MLTITLIDSQNHVLWNCDHRVFSSITEHILLSTRQSLPALRRVPLDFLFLSLLPILIPIRYRDTEQPSSMRPFRIPGRFSLFVYAAAWTWFPVEMSRGDVDRCKKFDSSYLFEFFWTILKEEKESIRTVSFIVPTWRWNVSVISCHRIVFITR